MFDSAPRKSIWRSTCENGSCMAGILLGICMEASRSDCAARVRKQQRGATTSRITTARGHDRRTKEVISASSHPKVPSPLAGVVSYLRGPKESRKNGCYGRVLSSFYFQAVNTVYALVPLCCCLLYEAAIEHRLTGFAAG